MNFSGWLGAAAALAVFIFSIIESSSNQAIFLDRHAILIVIGGTFAATLFSFPFGSLWTLARVGVEKILGQRREQVNAVIREIVLLSKGLSDDPGHLSSNWENIQNPFLRDAIELMIHGGVSSDELDVIIAMRSETHSKRYEEDALMFKTISKFPPAFGLMGTTLGMITLLQGIGSADAIKSVGPAMAIGLVATFYGIALANLVFIPIAENLLKLNRTEESMREVVMEGVKLLRKKSHPLVVEEYLKSFLLPKERIALGKVAS